MLVNREKKDIETWEGYSRITRRFPILGPCQRQVAREVDKIIVMACELRDKEVFAYQLRRLLRNTGIRIPSIGENGEETFVQGPLNRAQSTNELTLDTENLWCQIDMKHAWEYEKDYETFARNIKTAHKLQREEDAE